MNNESENNTIPINLYFKDSRSDIFDQISSNNSTMMDSVLENSKADNYFVSVEDNKCNVKSEGIETEEQPAICRIFSDDTPQESKSSDKLFFDILSASMKPSVNEKQSILNTNSANIFNRFDFPKTDYVLSENDAFSDEVFIKGINHHTTSDSAEANRRRDAWIPSSRTRQALITAATSPHGIYVPNRELLTMPGVVLQEDMVDSVYQAVNHYLGEAEALQRKVLTVNNVTQDEKGLKELIQAECYRAAVNLTSRLLSIYGQGIGKAGYPSKHTLRSVQLWFTRIALLVKLRSWSVAWAESEAWWDLDKPDLYFQFYSKLYGGRPGTLVPFSFRLLLAELPHYVHRSQEALRRLFSVLSTVRKILKNLKSGLSEDGSHFEISDYDREESKKLWSMRETRVLHSVINIAFQQQDYKLAIKVLQDLTDHPRYEYTILQKRSLISSLARTYLQLGDIQTARSYFDQSSSLKPTSQNQNNVPDEQDLVNLGLLAVAENDYLKGFEYFNEAIKQNPSNIMTVNNAAVCLLYQGKQKTAVRLLESIIESNPAQALDESLLLNVCTLYELESSRSIENKYKILKLISKYKGDSISLNCLKLQIRD